MKKKNVIILIVAVFMFIAACVFVLCNGNSRVFSVFQIGAKNNQSSAVKTNVLDELLGEWGMCVDKSCYGIIITKEDNKYSYVTYKMWTDGVKNGEVKSFGQLNTNTYSMKVYYPAIPASEAFEAKPEENAAYVYDLSELSSGILNVENKKYRRITGNREDFFNKLLGNNQSSAVKTNVLDELLGEWGMCVDKSCYGIIITKEDNKYNYVTYKMWTDGVKNGEVKSFGQLNTNTYSVEVYYPAIPASEAFEAKPEENAAYVYDLSELSSGILNVENKKYRRITGNKEDFFNKLLGK